VRIFFVISGYLITTLLLKGYEKTGSISLREFYKRRTLRIFPAFYSFLLVLIIGNYAGLISFRPGDLVHAATYTVNFHYDRSWWIGHIWSLSVEEQFYLLWPAVLVLLGIRRGLTVALWAVIAAPLVRLAVFYMLPSQRIGIGESFPTIADTIATGCLLAGYGPWLQRQELYQRILRSSWFGVIPLLAIRLAVRHEGRIQMAVGETLLNVAIALVIARCTSTKDGWVGRVLNCRPFVYIGVWSYSLYLFQQLFLNRHSESLIATFPLNLVLTFCAALACHYCVEKPFLSLRDHKRKHARVGVAPLSAPGVASRQSTP
jgi:peptidoglycan/LPS O-acetylase OafA/YrhL